MKKTPLFILSFCLFLFNFAFADFWFTEGAKRGTKFYWSGYEMPKEPWFTKIKKKNVDFAIFTVESVEIDEDLSQASFKTALSSPVRKILKFLDACQENGLKVVLEMPLVYKKAKIVPQDHNGLFLLPKAAHVPFWMEIVQQVKEHPQLVGYMLAKCDAGYQVPPDAELNPFYERAVTQIRKIDPKCAIIVQAQSANLLYFKQLKRLMAKDILYSVNTHEMQKPCRFWGILEPLQFTWTQDVMKKMLQEVDLWAKQNGVLPNQILISDYFPKYSLALGKEADVQFFVQQFLTYGWHTAYSSHNRY